MDVDVVDGPEACISSEEPLCLASMRLLVLEDQRVAAGVSADKEPLDYEAGAEEPEEEAATVAPVRDRQPDSADLRALDMALLPPRELAGAAMTLCCGTGQPEKQQQQQPKVPRQDTTAQQQPKPTEGCLLRLFESQVFDMSMAISYLFNSKEPGVQSYLGEFSGGPLTELGRTLFR